VLRSDEKRCQRIDTAWHSWWEFYSSYIEIKSLFKAFSMTCGFQAVRHSDARASQPDARRDSIVSNPKCGTEINVRVPLEAADVRQEQAAVV